MSALTVPEQFLYTKDHVWIKLEGDKARIGITDFAQNELGDINYVELPAIGKKFKINKPVANIEALKSATEVYAPLSGEITAANDTLGKEPTLINSAPYTTGWICEFKVTDAKEIANLLKPEAYQSFIANLNT